MQFSEILGQERVKQKLINQVKTGRISHAQLFLGTEGGGNLALAIAFTQYLMCENKQEMDSCGHCPACKRVSKLIHPDIHFSFPFVAKDKTDTSETYLDSWREMVLESPYADLELWRQQLDIGNKQFNINIAECQRILKRLSLKPYEAEYKVMILWLPEFLDKEGNTLLKFIEEPTDKTVFLLVAHRTEQILNTILSRTQTLKIPPLSVKEVESYLIQKDIEPLRAKQAAYLSEGNVQKAYELLENDANDYFSLLAEWFRKCFMNDGITAIAISEKIADLGRENQKSFMLYALKVMRECLMMQAQCAELVHLSEQEKDFVSKFSKNISKAQIQAMVTEFEKCHYHIERNASPKILFLDVSLQLVKILRFQQLPQGVQNIFV